MIGGQGNDDGIAVAFKREHSARRDRGAGITANWLQHNIDLYIYCGDLLRYQKTILPVCHYDRPAEQGRVIHPAERLLKC